MADLKASGLARFDLVEDAVVHVLQGWSDDAAEAVAVLAYHIDAGLHSSFLCTGEQAGCFRAELRVGRVQFIEQEQIAEVKYPGLDLRKVQVLAGPVGVRAARVEERAFAVGLLRHHIGERC